MEGTFKRAPEDVRRRRALKGAVASSEAARASRANAILDGILTSQTTLSPELPPTPKGDDSEVES